FLVALVLGAPAWEGASVSLGLDTLPLPPRAEGADCDPRSLNSLVVMSGPSRLRATTISTNHLIHPTEPRRSPQGRAGGGAAGQGRGRWGYSSSRSACVPVRTSVSRSAFRK